MEKEEAIAFRMNIELVTDLYQENKELQKTHRKYGIEESRMLDKIEWLEDEVERLEKDKVNWERKHNRKHNDLMKAELEIEQLKLKKKR
jgi:hypothetical protein